MVGLIAELLAGSYGTIDENFYRNIANNKAQRIILEYKIKKALEAIEEAYGQIYENEQTGDLYVYDGNGKEILL